MTALLVIYCLGMLCSFSAMAAMIEENGDFENWKVTTIILIVLMFISMLWPLFAGTRLAYLWLEWETHGEGTWIPKQVKCMTTKTGDE